jgi:hypothetical protein
LQAGTSCPGCGARNASAARACEWCGRAFLLRDQRRYRRLLWRLGALACALTAAGLAAMVALGPRGGLPSPPSPAPTTIQPAAEPVADTPSLPPDEPPAEPEPSPTVEYVRVANTGGQGIVLRREPTTSAPRVAARAENSLFRIVGADRTVDGRVWREVEDMQGNRGWTPAEFLVPATPPP